MRPLGDIFSASGRKPYLRGFILCDGRPDSDILPLELWLAGCQRGELSGVKGVDVVTSLRENTIGLFMAM